MRSDGGFTLEEPDAAAAQLGVTPHTVRDSLCILFRFSNFLLSYSIGVTLHTVRDKLCTLFKVGFDFNKFLSLFSAGY